ncbi:hypothetical protein Cni_G23085 [Canna indica]|uniref:Reverse transcriptase domain-containing protein n=1 Tax=Canna indica TaxID=4628 RepID=A0AAQ3KTB9_9LILI|nr:hypothetical protein Cni_G23085 [Canna indica]
MPIKETKLKQLKRIWILVMKQKTLIGSSRQRLSIGSTSDQLLNPNWDELFSDDFVEQEDLIRSCTNEEILEALKSLGKDKAPGPDGLTAKFYLKFWDIIEDNMRLVLSDFCEERCDLARANKSFIIPIPKVEGANKMGEFRPISLTTSIVKIFSKLLASKLKSLLEIMIEDTQCAFLPGRSTLDSFMAASETIHFCKKNKLDTIMLKLDLSNAFDSVDWDFLLKLLRHRGFPEKWVGWISILLKMGESSVLLNGEQGKWIKHKKGLRQGDPLSPYLFLLIADVFARMLKRAARMHLIKGVSMGGEFNISNLQFADDFVVFTKGDRDDLINLKILLYGYEVMTGLKANISKTEALHVLGNDDKSAKAAGILGPKEYGGLGIINLEKHNLARLGKWWWALATDKKMVWVEIVKMNYFQRRKWYDDNNANNWSRDSILKGKDMFALGS